MPDWSNFVTLNGEASKVSGTSLVFTVGSTGAAALAALLVIIACDNIEITDTEDGSDIVSVTDSRGNTYERVKTYTNGQGAAAAGVTVGVYYSKITAELMTGDQVTVTFASPIRAKAMTLGRLAIDASKDIAVAGTAVQADDGSEPSAIALSSLPSREYLFVHAIGKEGNLFGLTADPDYDKFDSHATGGGSSFTNIAISGGVRILTDTGDSVETVWGSADYAQAFAALYLEDTTPPEPSSPLTFTVRSESVKRFPLGVA